MNVRSFAKMAICQIVIYITILWYFTKGPSILDTSHKQNENIAFILETEFMLNIQA